MNWLPLGLRFKECATSIVTKLNNDNTYYQNKVYKFFLEWKESLKNKSLG